MLLQGPFPAPPVLLLQELFPALPVLLLWGLFPASPVLLLPVLHSARFNVSFPFAAILLAASLGLLCRYFRRAKAVSDDNQTII